MISDLVAESIKTKYVKSMLLLYSGSYFLFVLTVILNNYFNYHISAAGACSSVVG
jgi:hypothetical protein